MKMLSIFAGMLITVSLSGCVSSESPDVRERLLDMGLEMGETGARIPRYRINGWQPIDDYFLVVTAGVNDRYLIELTTPCFGLQGAFFVGFTTPNFNVDNFDRLVTRRTGDRPEFCDIEEITRLYDIDG